MGRSVPYGLTLGVTLAALAGVVVPARAQDVTCNGTPGELEVRKVSFAGNRHYRGGELANAIVTTPSSWFQRLPVLHFGARRCLDTLELRRDVYRLRLFYRQRGYYHSGVDTRVIPRGGSLVAVAFRVNEGEPVLIDSMRVLGLDSVQGGPDLVRRLMGMRRRPYDRVRLSGLVDSVMDRLRNEGYARAEQTEKFDSVDTDRDRATVMRSFAPGPLMRIGRLAFEIDPYEPGAPLQIPERVVRKLLSFREGKVYRQQDLLDSQRDLYQTEAYRLVEVSLAPDSLQPRGDSLVVLTRLSEGTMRSMRLGAGYGTLDCIRAQGRFTDRNFFGGARRLEVNGRLSKIGVGAPLDFARSICPSLRDDQFSDNLNYYGGITFRPPALFGPRNIPSLTVFSERRSEFNAYLRETPFGANASLTRELQQRTPLTVSYQVEFGRTTANAAVFCSIFNTCDLGAISRLQGGGSLQTFSVGVARDRTDNIVDPRAGSLMRLDLRHGISSLSSGSGAQFNKGFIEGTLYRSVGRGTTFAGRLQIGGVLAQNLFSGVSDFVPPQERLYAGGPNSVRGYNQNELGPVVYIVSNTTSFARIAPGQPIPPELRNNPDSAINSGADTLFLAGDTARLQRFSPTGGNALIVGNLELRFRSPIYPERVQLSTFLDFGQVWTRRNEIVSFGDLRFTPGVGARLGTPVGLVGVDVGYRRYASQPGPAFFVGRLHPELPLEQDPPTLLCVSPGNLLAEGQLPIGASCPSTFAPALGSSFRSHLTLHVSIGQAF